MSAVRHGNGVVNLLMLQPTLGAGGTQVAHELQRRQAGFYLGMPFRHWFSLEHMKFTPQRENFSLLGRWLADIFYFMLNYKYGIG
jgi:hypothetical protein